MFSFFLYREGGYFGNSENAFLRHLSIKLISKFLKKKNKKEEIGDENDGVRDLTIQNVDKFPLVYYYPPPIPFLFTNRLTSNESRTVQPPKLFTFLISRGYNYYFHPLPSTFKELNASINPPKTI